MTQDKSGIYGDMHPFAKTVNPRDWKTIKGYIDAVKEGKRTSLRQCAIQAGFAKSYATAAANRVGRIMTNNEAVREKMEAEGIGIDSFVRDLVKLSKAKLPPHKDGIQYDDNEVQFKVLDLRANIQDLKATKRLEIDERKIIINIDASKAEKVKAYLTEAVESA